MAGAAPIFGNFSSDAVTGLTMERGDRCKVCCPLSNNITIYELRNK